MRALAKNLLAVLGPAMVVLYFAQSFPQMQKGLDFADFYAGARMVRDGRGGELYDPLLQDQYLIRYSGRVGSYFNHPPFETLIYLPFALLPLSRAYTLWCVFQAILLIAVAKLLEREGLRRWSWRVLVLVFLLYVPLLLDFLQGQDALLLLFLLTLAFVTLERKREFGAGCLLGCGLFKFHLAFPAALPFFFIGRKKLACGFALVAMALLVVSIWISGWTVIATYPRFLLHLGTLPLAGIHNAQKANLRGLFGLLLPGWEGAALGLTLLSSALILGLTVRFHALAMRNAVSARLAFANTVFAALLVGYHLSPHDLSILILPMILLADHLLTGDGIPRGTRLVLLLALGVLFLPPLHLLLLHVHLYSYACLPALVLFGATCTEIRRTSARRLDGPAAASVTSNRSG